MLTPSLSTHRLWLHLRPGLNTVRVLTYLGNVYVFYYSMFYNGRERFQSDIEIINIELYPPYLSLLSGHHQHKKNFKFTILEKFQEICCNFCLLGNKITKMERSVWFRCYIHTLNWALMLADPKQCNDWSEPSFLLNYRLCDLIGRAAL